MGLSALAFHDFQQGTEANAAPTAKQTDVMESSPAPTGTGSPDLGGRTLKEAEPRNPRWWDLASDGTKRRRSRSHPDSAWNGSAAAAASGLPVGAEGRGCAEAMLPFTVNFKVSARTLTGALNAHNKAAVDW